MPLSMGLKMKSRWTPRRWDETMVDGYRCVVGSLGWCWQTDSTSAQPGFFLWATMPGATFCCGASVPAAMSMGSTGPFDSMISSPGGLPPGSQRAIAPIFGSLCGGVACSRSWFLGGISTAPSSRRGASPCSRTGSRSSLFGRRSCFRDGASGLHLRLCGGASSSGLPSCGGFSTLRPALSCA